jgi:ankyrin repeat protein/uncharacterized membrane protein
LLKSLTKDEFDARLTTGDTPLIVACALNKAQIVHSLIQRGADVNATSTRGWTPLMTSAFFGNHDIAEYLLTQGAKADYRSEDGATARSIAEWRGDQQLVTQLPLMPPALSNTPSDLVRAVSSGNHLEITRLLTAGVKPEASDASGTPALLIATAAGDTFALNSLIKAGAPADLAGANGITALMVATQQRRINIVKVLLAAGADPLHQTGNKGPSSLTIAEALGYDDISSLLRNSITRVAGPVQGLSLLSSAVAADDTSQVGRLLKVGAKPVGGVIEGRRIVPISIAAFKGFDDLLSPLLAAGADVNEPDDKGSTPLMAAIAGSHPKTAELLIQSGARLDVVDKAGISPVAMARAAGWRNLGVRDLYTTDDFDAALKKGDLNTLRTLLNGGGHDNWVSGRDERGWPSLTRAAEAGTLEIVLLLLSHGAAVEISDNSIPSPLMVAAAMGKKDIVKVLLKQGADPLREDGAHHTAADMAKQRNQRETAAIIQASARIAARRINSGLAALGLLNSAGDGWTDKSRNALTTFYDQFPSGHQYDAPLTFGAPAAIEEALNRTVRVCNSTPKKVWIAWVRDPHDYADTQNVDGWNAIDPSGCQWIVHWNVNQTMKPIWITAESIGTIKWSGDEKLCVLRTAMNGMSVSRGPGCSNGTHEAGFWHVVPGSPNPIVLRYGK